MLVLSRKKDESIVINNDITIVVVEIRGDKVRLGVEAPKEVPVHRREVYEAIARGESADVPLASMPADTQTGEAAPEDPAGLGWQSARTKPRDSAVPHGESRRRPIPTMIFDVHSVLRIHAASRPHRLEA